MLLFQRKFDESPIVFDCCEISANEHAEITELVENNGGCVGDSSEPLKFMPRSRYKPGMYSNLQVYDIRFIASCVTAGKLVRLSSFRLGPRKPGDRCQESVFLTGECMFKCILRESKPTENAGQDFPSDSEDDEEFEPPEARNRRLRVDESQSVVANIFSRRLRANDERVVKRKHPNVSVPREAIKPEPVSQSSDEPDLSVLWDSKIHSSPSPGEKSVDRRPPIDLVSQSGSKPEAASRRAPSESQRTNSTETPDSTVWESFEVDESPTPKKRRIHTRVDVEFLSDDSQDSPDGPLAAWRVDEAARPAATNGNGRKRWIVASSSEATTSECVSRETIRGGGNGRIAASSPRGASRKFPAVSVKSPLKRNGWINPDAVPENPKNRAAPEIPEEDDVEASLVKLFLDSNPKEAAEKAVTSTKASVGLDEIVEVAASDSGKSSAAPKPPERTNGEHESHDAAKSQETLDGLLAVLNDDNAEKSPRESSGKSGENEVAAPSPRESSGKSGENEVVAPSPRESSGKSGENEVAAPSPRESSGKSGENEVAAPSPRESSEKSGENEVAAPSPRESSGKSGENEVAAPSPRESSEKGEKNEVAAPSPRESSEKGEKNEVAAPSLRKSTRVTQSPSSKSAATRKRTKRSVQAPRAKRNVQTPRAKRSVQNPRAKQTTEEKNSRGQSAESSEEAEEFAKPGPASKVSRVNKLASNAADEKKERPKLRPKSARARPSKVSSEEDDDSSEEEDDSLLGRKSKKARKKALRYHRQWRARLNEGVPRPESLQRYMKFTEDERKRIVAFLCAQGDIEAQQPKGLKVWSVMMRQGLLANRTAKSLQNHFTKNILPNIEDYFDDTMTETQKAEFLKIRDSKRSIMQSELSGRRRLIKGSENGGENSPQR